MNIIPVFDALTGDLRYILTFRYKGIEEMRSVYLPRTLVGLETDFIFPGKPIQSQDAIIACNCDRDEFEIRFESIGWPLNSPKAGPLIKSRVVLADPELLSALDTLTRRGLPSHFEPYIQRLP